MTSSDRDREIAEQYREKATEIGKSMSESGISGGEHVSPTHEGAQFKPSDTPAKEQQTPEGIT
ncbi:hypothetical protein BGP_5139 [Beggiatoa sp. PS]|nr:hypothetical protein BGP_5139 [Beggiatoa sp. PS]